MEKVFAKLDSIHQPLLSLIEPVAEDKYSRRPSAGEWSIAENVHHLHLTEESFLKQLQKKIQEPPERLSLLGRLLQPPAWVAGVRLVRVRAPKFVEPLNAPSKAETIDNFNRTRAKLKAIGQEFGYDRVLNTVVKHPILGNFDGINIMLFLGYHELRHFKQIKEVLQKLS